MAFMHSPKSEMVVPWSPLPLRVLKLNVDGVDGGKPCPAGTGGLPFGAIEEYPIFIFGAVGVYYSNK